MGCGWSRRERQGAVGARTTLSEASEGRRVPKRVRRRRTELRTLFRHRIANIIHNFLGRISDLQEGKNDFVSKNIGIRIPMQATSHGGGWRWTPLVRRAIRHGKEWSPMKKKMTFALCFGNRGFMPGELILGARDDMVKAVTDAGYDYIMMEEAASRYGAVETRDEGLQYAAWLKEHEGQNDGVIFCMPIFVDEKGIPGRDRQIGLCPPPRRLLRQVLGHGRVLPVQGALHRTQAARGASADPRLPAEPARLRRHLPRGQRHEALQPRLHRRAHHRLQDRAL